MTPLGWAIMVMSIGTVLTLLTFCLYKVFALPQMDVEESLHGPGNIDTEDTLDAD
ncbi:MAG: hypothetical protein R3C01_04000 [Planctomycetaceae bacterium]